MQDSQEQWPNADRNEEGTLKEVLTLKFAVEHHPADARILVDLITVDKPMADLVPPTVSNTLDVFLRDRFGVGIDDYAITTDPADLQPRVTERNYAGDGYETDWNLTDDYRLVQPDAPAVGDELTVDHQSGDEPAERIEGTVVDATPRRTDEGDRYWELELEVGRGGTVELSTEHRGTTVVHEHADGERREIGDLIGVGHTYKVDDEPPDF